MLQLCAIVIKKHSIYYLIDSKNFKELVTSLIADNEDLAKKVAAKEYKLHDAFLWNAYLIMILELPMYCSSGTNKKNPYTYCTKDFIKIKK